MTVTLASLGDLCEINPRLSRALADDDPVSFLPMAAVSEDGHIAFEEMKTAREVRKGYTYFERGDVLLAKITPCFENGKAAGTSSLSHKVGFGSTEFHVLRPSPRIDASYLKHMIWNTRFREVGAQNMTGSAGQKRVPADFLRRVEVPLPPPSEQRRIAAILDKADALRRKRRLAAPLIKRLSKAFFVEMFGDLASNEREYGIRSISEVARSIDYGLTASAHSEPIGPKFLRITDLQEGKVDWDMVPFCDAPFRKCEAARLSVGDLVFARTGATTGKSFLVSNLPKTQVVFASYLIRIRSGERINPVWLAALFQTEFYWSYIRRSARGAAQGGVNATTLGGFASPIPPIEEQEAFARRMSRVQTTATQLQSQFKLLEAQFASLQHRAFTGQL